MLNGSVDTTISATSTGLELSTYNSYPLLIKTNNTERARFDTNGNLGIGTTSPNYLTDIQSTTSPQTLNLKLNKASTTNDYAEIAFQLWSGAGSGANTFGGSGTSRPSVVLRALNENGSTAAGAFIVGTFTGGSDNSTLTEKFRITSGGNVGIGTTSPSQLLEVVGSSPIIRVLATSGNATLRLTDNGVRNWDLKVVDVNDYFEVGGTSATSLVVTGAGNVGIGTNSPAYKLEVASGTSGEQSLVNFRTADSTAANNAGVLIFATPSSTATSREAVMLLDADGANASGGDYFLIKKRGNSGTTDFEQYSNASMRFGTNFISRATYDMTIANDGIVGIGTTSPGNSKLHIYADHISGHSILKIQTITAIASGGVPSLALFDADGSRNTLVYAASDGTYLANEVAKPIIFSTNGVEKMRIASDGNVLIGTSTSTTNGGLLQIAQVPNNTASSIGFNNEDNAVISAKYNLVFQIDNTNSVSGREYQWKKGGKGYSDGTSLMILNASGSVGIGTSSPAAKLHVNSSTMIVGDTATTQNVRQTIVGSTTGNASTTAKKIFVCGHTSTGTINVTAIITSVSTASATATFSFANAYGSSATPNRLSYISLNSTITSIDCNYNNTGYQMEISVTYTGATAPTLYFTAEGMGSSTWTL
jgi:hypothetical protein